MFVYKRGKSSILSTSPLRGGDGAMFLLFFELLCRLRVNSMTLEANSGLVDGRKERVQFDKITARVSRLCYGLDGDHVDAAAITQKVISGVYQGVTTIELDNLVGWPTEITVILVSNDGYRPPRQLPT